MPPQTRIIFLVATSIIIYFSISLFGPRTISADNSTQDNANNSLTQGLEHLGVGEYETAIEHFKKCMNTEEGKAIALRGWADALVATGNYKEAEEILKKALEDEKESTILSRLGRVYLRIGELEKAREILEQAASLDSSSPEILYSLAESYRQSGLLEKASALFQQSIDVYREMSAEEAENLPAEAFVYWGLSLIALNRYQDAKEIMFPQAEEIDPENLLLYLKQGNMFLEKYNFPDSRFFYRKAIDQNPDYADALAALADNYITDFMVGTKRYDLAEKYLDRALEVNPHHSRAHVVRGRIWFYDGRLSRAIKELEKALLGNPANLQARGMLAAVYHVMGDKAAFKKEESEALKINPKGAEFYHSIALSIEPKFRYPDTVRMCDRALELDPDYWPAYVTLGINCLRTGENARGRKFLEKSWSNDKYNLWVFNTRILLKHMDKNFTSWENEDFVYYLPARDAPFMRPYLESLLKRAHESISRRYQVKIEGPVQVESFSTHKWFSARTVGLEGFAASGACFGKLVTLTTPKALPQNWGAVAWHEFAHVATIQLTNYRVPRWLTEGISVYEEGYEHPHWARNFQRDIADAWGSGRLLPMSQLDYGFSKPKFPMQILLSYYQGCLIIQYIEGKWGFDAVLKILNGYKNFKSTDRIFREVLDQELAEFDQGFGSFVSAWVKKNGYTPVVAEEMVPRLQLAVEKDLDNPKALCDLAWAYICNNNKVDATINAGKALELDPKYGDAHAILGLIQYAEEKRSLAQEHFEKALAMDTRLSFRVNALMGDILAKHKSTRKMAIQHYEKAKKISPIAGAGYPPGKNIYYKLAKYYEQEKQPDKAILQMEELASFANEDPECRMRIVEYALINSDPEKAARYLDELIYINPFNLKIHANLAHVAEQLGNHDTVIREQELLLLFPETNAQLAHLALAKAYLAKKNNKKAAEEARKVLDIDPDSEDASKILKEAMGTS